MPARYSTSKRDCVATRIVFGSGRRGGHSLIPEVLEVGWGHYAAADASHLHPHAHEDAHVRRLEAAGAFAVEMEVVPDRVAAEISRRTSMLVVSMGGGPGCDGQYLLAEDMLGTNIGHYPRHAKRYRNFAVEYARLQQERIAAFGEFKCEVESGRYPAAEHVVRIADLEFETFVQKLPSVLEC